MTISKDYLRSSIFGVEDALVSTTGLVIGMSVGIKDPSIILLAGFVGVSVEALSMAAGEYLSDKAVQELQKTKKGTAVKNSLIMFISYFLAGIIPIMPFMLFEQPISQWASLLFALVGLGVLGYSKAKIVKISIKRSIIEMVVVGGLATLLGIAVGIIFKV
jgi:VIT1/CCC1 family predicted Fe2+/Mn2+ transporter